MADKIYYEGPRWVYRHSFTDCPQQKGFVMHAHDNCEILLFLSGHGTYLVESSEYPLRSGSILVMRPGEVHMLKVNPDTPYDRVVFSFPTDLLTGDLSSLLEPFTGRPLGTGNLFAPEEYDSLFVLQCIRRFEQIYDTADHAVSLISLLDVLGEIYRAFCLRSAEPLTDAEPSNRTRDIIRFVNEHLLEELTLDTICEEFFLSKTQLGRIFRRATGSTVWDYILVKRLIEARRQVLSGVPVNQVAEACGFRDYSAFFRAYTKRYGVSPTADRQITYRVK